MPICFVVPGFGGTTLKLATSFNPELWVSYTRLAIGQAGAMRLAADGVSPGPPDGEQLTAGDPLGDYYALCVQMLEAGLRPAGYSVLPWGYDWRMSIVSSGAALAAAVRSRSSVADPCSIVCHSLGVLVTRVAWSHLVGTGDEGLVRRIVALGGPNYGTYRPGVFWARADESVQQLYYINTATNILVTLAGVVTAVRQWSLRELAELGATWPSLYEMLPNLGTPDAAADPQRQCLYDASNWSDRVTLSQAWLDHARTVTGPLLAGPTTVPPSWVLTCIAGTGVTSADSVIACKSLGNLAAFGTRDAADRLVTVESALLPGAAHQTLNCIHNDLQTRTAVDGSLVAAVLDTRVAPDPPPPPVVQQNQLVTTIAGPPLPLPFVRGHDC